MREATEAPVILTTGTQTAALVVTGAVLLTNVVLLQVGRVAAEDAEEVVGFWGLCAVSAAKIVKKVEKHAQRKRKTQRTRVRANIWGEANQKNVRDILPGRRLFSNVHGLHVSIFRHDSLGCNKIEQQVKFRIALSRSRSKGQFFSKKLVE